jgi:deoxyribose-phosphate aldolase
MRLLTDEEKKILLITDHTLLSVDASPQQIRAVCTEGIAYQVASVCLPPAYVPEAVEFLAGRLPVCTVIGFPNGYSSTGTKVFEAVQAQKDGASEIDAVIHVGMLKSGGYDRVRDELFRLREACRDSILKIIIETCLLSNDEKIRMCEMVTEAGADFIKTSTGFSGAGATVDDVRLLKSNVGPKVLVKAAGGISTIEDALQMIEAGASRLGTSKMIRIIAGRAQAGY